MSRRRNVSFRIYTNRTPSPRPLRTQQKRSEHWRGAHCTANPTPSERRTVEQLILTWPYFSAHRDIKIRRQKSDKGNWRLNASWFGHGLITPRYDPG